MEISKLVYNIIPAQASGDPELIRLHNQVYDFWKKVWTDTLQKMELPSLDRSHILKQDYICFLTYGPDVVASHLYSVFDIRLHVTQESDYFSQMSSDIQEYCQKKSIYTMMTQEYLAVHPEWRKTTSGVSIPEILIGLGIQLMHSINCDSTVGTTRAGAPSVERICHEINADLLPNVIMRYNMPHKFFIANKKTIRLPGDQQTQTQIASLWDSKNDYRDNRYQQKQPKAA